MIDNEIQIIRLKQIAKFTKNILYIKWFSRTNESLSNLDIELSEKYISAVGLPESNISNVSDWVEAAGIAENPNWNSNWWEIEEQLKASLITESLKYIYEEELSHALNHVTSQTAGQSLEAVAFEKFAEDSENITYYQSFVNAAAGMAIASAYQAALVLSASADQDHPFSLKFQLFENGRLPIGIIGNTFSIF
ncbi:MAG: hypothetical protein CFH01_00435 [Alphaproteobacteria bacterium MarineAlpha2_Bin1]|nr:MAG: hypothetical protein CFH01_00435 [Alphaproteobacteria bacterium MarineAlpha2_Bin1]|tara:strand:+ start:1209 stop:1787 length:579 start_codon:yes stop_codon:yes gene_type:complete